MTKNLKTKIDDKLNKKIYFSSANTAAGLVNYSSPVFNPQNFDKIYIIKGIFAQNFISKIAEKYSCECFLNPVNPAKTDGLIINKTAVIDGVFANYDESLYPALIINLGEFCDLNILNQNKEQISRIIKQKQTINKLTRKFLKAASELADYFLELSAEYLNEKKLISAIDRILNKRLIDIKNIQTDYRFINSVAAGELDTLEKEANKIFYISNEYLTGFHFMRYIAKKTTGSKIICPDASDIKNIRAVYINDEKILFALQSKSEKLYDDKYNHINMERFVSPDLKKAHKQKLKFIKKTYDALIAEVKDCFTNIDSLNKELEKIYAQSLDYDAQQKFTTDFLKKL